MRTILILVLAALLLLEVSDGASDPSEVIQASKIFDKIESGENLDGVIVEGNLDLSGEILKAVHFNETIFRGSVDFKGASFTDDVWFLGSNFTGIDADFHGARFENDANFRNAKFWDQLNFEGTQFEGDANFFESKFGGSTNFNNAEFWSLATFENAQFNGDAYFSWAQFKDDADFFGAQFEANAKFSGAQFKDDSDFFGAQFESNAIFSESKFEGNASFYRAKFSDNRNLMTSFRNASFNGRTYFNEAQFSRYCTLKWLIFCDRDKSTAPSTTSCGLSNHILSLGCFFFSSPNNPNLSETHALCRS